MKALLIILFLVPVYLFGQVTHIEYSDTVTYSVDEVYCGIFYYEPETTDTIYFKIIEIDSLIRFEVYFDTINAGKIIRELPLDEFYYLYDYKQ